MQDTVQFDENILTRLDANLARLNQLARSSDDESETDDLQIIDASSDDHADGDDAFEREMQEIVSKQVAEAGKNKNAAKKTKGAERTTSSKPD